MDKQEEIPMIFYLYVYGELVGRTSNRLISLKEAHTFLHEWRIPKHIRIAMIKEMQTLGWMEETDRYTLRIKKRATDLSNPTKVYEMVGLVTL